MIHGNNILSQTNINQQLEHKVKLRTRDLEDARQVAESANQQKSRFLAAASHDIRQPLHALRLLTDTLSTAEISTSKHAISGAVEHLVALFDMLFDLSTLDNNLVKPDNKTFNINKWLNSLTAHFESLCLDKGLNFQVNVPQSDFWLKTDTLLLQRILQILVDNGIKHSEGSLIIINLKESESQLIIEVKDNGKGIDESEHDYVFDEFYQLKPSDLSAERGMGLGLSLAKRISLLLNVPLMLSNNLGGGCCFSMTFEKASPQEKLASQIIQKKQAEITGLRILVVEDNVMASDALKQTLSQWGMEVQACQSAATTLQLLNSGWMPDMAILDYGLPDIENGWELAKQIHAIPTLSDLPIITMSANLELISSPEKPAYPILPKPIKPSVLRAAITRYTMGKQKKFQ